MSLASADLPSDPDALRAFALACQSELAAATAELHAAKLAVQLRTLEIEKLKFQIAKLRRMQFGCVFRAKAATDSGMKSATDSDLIPAIPI